MKGTEKPEVLTSKYNMEGKGFAALRKRVASLQKNPPSSSPTIQVVGGVTPVLSVVAPSSLPGKGNTIILFHLLNAEYTTDIKSLRSILLLTGTKNISKNTWIVFV